MRYKKLLIVLGLLSSLSVQAGVYQCKQDMVSVPCATSSWALGGDALYLQPSSSSLFVNNFGPTNQRYNMRPDWGFKIAAAVYFSKANDFNINWTYFNTSEQMVDNLGVKYTGRQGAANPGTVFDDSNKFSVVNLELGQKMSAGEFWDMRFHFGMQIANTKDRDTATRADNGALVSDTIKVDMVGARAGLNIDYNFYQGLKLYLNAALGLLYAAQAADHSAQSILASNTNFVDAPVNAIQNENAVAIDYNLGLSYHYAVQQGDLSARIGWTAYHWTVTGATEIGYQGLLFGMNWRA